MRNENRPETLHQQIRGGFQNIMYPVLAEISGNMPTVCGMWAWGCVLGLPFLVGLVHRWLALVLLPVGLVFSAELGYSAYHEAYLEGAFSEIVWKELGRCWVATSLASAVVPAAVAIAVNIWWLNRRHREQPSKCSGRTPLTRRL